MKVLLLLPLLLSFLFAAGEDINIIDFASDIRVVNGYERRPCGFTIDFDTPHSSHSVNVRYYLSNDTIVDSETDSLISNETMNLYDGTVGYGKYQDIPFSPQYQYLLLSINEDRSLTESDYTNNIRYARLNYEEPYYDLAINSYRTHTGSTVIQGDNVRLIVSLKNSGNVSSDASYKIFLSTDTIIDEQDLEVADNSDGSFIREFTHNYSETGDLTGKLYFLLQADPLNEYEESNEENNVEWLDFTFISEDYEIKADSVITQDSYISAGSEINFTYTYSNTGTTGAQYGYNTFQTGVYISEDNILSEDDSLIQVNSNSVVGGGSSATDQYNTAVIPESFKDLDTVYLILELNYNEQLRMDDLTNNIVSTPVELKEALPDIHVSNYYPYFGTNALFVSYGSPFEITHIISNNGTKSAEVSISYHLSEDSLLDEDDLFLKQADFGNVNYNSKIYPREQLAEELPYPEGTYYLIQIKDPEGLIPREISQNNKDTVISKVFHYEQFKPEFVFEFTDVSQQEASVGEAVGFHYYDYIISELSQDIDESLLYTQVHISQDRILDENDPVVSNLSYSFGTRSGSFNVPHDWSSDSLFVIFHLNGERRIEENIYENNIAIHGIKVNGIITSFAGAGSRNNPLPYRQERADIIFHHKGKAGFRLFNLQGQRLLSTEVVNGSRINLENFNPGIYLILLSTEEANLKEKIILR